MSENLCEEEVESQSGCFIMLPFRPALEWHIHGLYEELGTASVTNYLNGDFIDIQNYEAGEFMSLLKVDDAKQQDINRSITNTYSRVPNTYTGSLMKLACTLDILDITRCLLANALAKCTPGITVNETFTNSIAQKLAQAIDCPVEKNDESAEPTMLSLTAAIALHPETGQVIAYAVGQLLGPGDMVMAIKGCALTEKTRDMIVDSVKESLLSGSETSA